MSWNAHIWCLLGVSMLLVALFDLAFVGEHKRRAVYQGDAEWRAVYPGGVDRGRAPKLDTKWVVLGARAAR